VNGVDGDGTRVEDEGGGLSTGDVTTGLTTF
jgi:hypothetical protein